MIASIKLKGTVLDAATALRHPAFLFSAGNTALAVGQAHLPALLLNTALTVVVYASRFAELHRRQVIGIPFIVLVSVNLVTALSVEFNRALSFAGGFHFLSLNQQTIAAHASAFAYTAWAIGHFFASRNERTGNRAQRAADNPQTYYGIGDIAAVNAAGTLNPFSFPFMVVGFMQSLRIGRTLPKKSRVMKEFTAARLYAVGYFVGALTSLQTSHFAVAQIFWTFAYLQFAKDTSSPKDTS